MHTMNRVTLSGTSPLERYAMAAGADIKDGDIVCLDGNGLAVEGADTAGLYVIGIAVAVDETANTVEVRDGIVGLEPALADTPTRADRGKPVYVADATKVAVETTEAVCAGVLVDVYDGLAFVEIRPTAAAAALAGSDAGAVAGAIAGDEAGAAVLVADLADGASTIKAAATSIAGDAVAAAGNVRLVEAPAAADAPGVKGDIAVDGTDLFICVDEDTWVKATLATATW